MHGSNQRGAALIMVVFVFAVAAAVTLSLVARGQIEIARTRNLVSRAQALQYALGMEELARQSLMQDALQSPEKPRPFALSGQLQQIFPVQHGKMSGTIEDLQSRFNLNSLGSPDALPLQRLRNLLSNLGLDPGLADKIQVQLTPSQSQTTASNARHTPLAGTITALKTVPGINSGTYAMLAPLLTVLPNPNSALNANTASPLIIQSYLPAAEAEIFLKKRAQSGFIPQGQFERLAIDRRGLQLTSDFFGVSALVEIDGYNINLASVLSRRGASGKLRLQVVSRDLGIDP